MIWRTFAVNAALLAMLALLLLVSPVEIDAPITSGQALLVLGALAVALAANALLLRRALAPLDRLSHGMKLVDPLRPGHRLDAARRGELRGVVTSFNEMLERLEKERQASAARILAAQEAERIAVARDLHDAVGQVLTAALLKLDTIGDRAPAVRDEANEAKEFVRQAIDEIGRIARELRPEALSELGLVSALTELSCTFARVSGIRVDREFEDGLPPLPPDTELAIYRIAQESLTNVARHADARRVTVSLRSAGSAVVLQVADDGRGFGTGEQADNGGLRSMRERAVLIDGSLTVESLPGSGVTVRLEVPTRAGAR